MKFRLSTIFWLFTLLCLATALFVTHQRYSSLYEKYARRERLVHAEFLRVTKTEPDMETLESILEETDTCSVGLARRVGEEFNYKAKVGELREPVIELKIRAGHGGGNTHRIDMAGQTSMYVRDKSNKSFEFEPVVGSDADRAYFDGGFIPKDKVLIIEEITCRYSIQNDSSHSEFILRIGGKPIFNVNGPGPFQDEKEWSGEIAINPGEERSVNVEVAYFAAAEVKIKGRFESLKLQNSEKSKR